MDDDDLTPDDATEDELWEMLEESSGVDRAHPHGILLFMLKF